MSIDDYNPDSPYQQYKHQRAKVYNLVFGRESNLDFPRCSVCLKQWRLHIEKSPDGKSKVGICKQGCGKRHQLDQQKEQAKLKLSHYEGQSTTIVISQKRKGRNKPKFDSVNNDLTEEDKEDIRGAGGAI